MEALRNPGFGRTGRRLFRAWLFPELLIGLVESMCPKQPTHLYFERHPLVMFLLGFDVLPDHWDLGLTHRECPVPCLPDKTRALGMALVHPERRPRFHGLDSPSHREIGRQLRQKVNMLVHPIAAEENAA